MSRFKFTTSQMDIRNAARVRQVSFVYDDESSRVSVHLEIGDDSGGAFVVKERKTLELEQPLPPALRTLVDDVATRALTHLSNKGVLPIGTEEPVRVSARPTSERE